MSSDPKYWFPAKRYGWGWGPPVTWQGWVVVAVFAVLVAAGVLLLPPSRALTQFVGYIALLLVALLAICFIKGEPPRWRWGEDE